MSPIVCGLLRIIMHSAMVMGACRNAPVSSLTSGDFFSLILRRGLARGGVEIGYRGGLMCMVSKSVPETTKWKPSNAKYTDEDGQSFKIAFKLRWSNLTRNTYLWGVSLVCVLNLLYPSLKSSKLHWLRFRYHVFYKIRVLYKALNGAAPCYIITPLAGH